MPATDSGAHDSTPGVRDVVEDAARTRHPDRSTGLDGALRYLEDVPLGRYELSVVSVGLLFFGVYLLTRARHLRR